MFELESLGQAWSKEELLNYLRTHIYPQPFIQEHLRLHMSLILGQTISQVEQLYRSTLGYPVPLSVSAISDAIVRIVEDRNRILGLRHTRRNYCGEHVLLGAGELPLAILTEPWPETTQPPHVISPPEVPTPWTPPDEQELGHITPVPTISLEPRSTIVCQSPEELRKEIATRIQDIEGSRIREVIFTIFVNYEDVDLAGYPSALRGALSGIGSLEVQLKITCPGLMDKAEAETRCESLPRFSNASYQARLSIETKPSLSISDSEDMEEEQ